MIWKYDMVHKEFETCAREHVNNPEIRNRMYREGLSSEEFCGQLQDILLPVYQSARNCGFGEWVYKEKFKCVFLASCHMEAEFWLWFGEGYHMMT